MKMKLGTIVFFFAGIYLTMSCSDPLPPAPGDCWQYRRMELHIKTDDSTTFSTAPMLPPGSFICLYEDGKLHREVGSLMDGEYTRTDSSLVMTFPDLVWDYTIGYETADSMVLYRRMPDDILIVDYLAK